MSERVHVSMELDVFVDDQQAIRQSAFERMRAAWSSDDEFPFESPSDVPLGQAIQSLLAAALPLEITGGRRSQLAIETEEPVSDDSSRDADDSNDKDSNDSDGKDTNDSNDSKDTDESDDGKDSDDSKDDENADDSHSANDGKKSD